MTEYTVYLVADAESDITFVGHTALDPKLAVLQLVRDGADGRQTRFAKHVRSVLGERFTAAEFGQRFRWKELHRTADRKLSQRRFREFAKHYRDLRKPQA